MGSPMTIVAPKERKHLSADALFGLVRNGFAHIPDYRLSETDISLADALMSAFAHRVRSERPTARIVYISAERFVNEFVAALPRRLRW